MYADSDQRESRSLAADIKLAIAFFWSGERLKGNGEREIQTFSLSPKTRKVLSSCCDRIFRNSESLIKFF